ncbi:MAG: LacI family DNA-binding transcriptional regulator [Candidatus Omnitrophica bacterium]|nr:LacI family DNA-binding transcriptional regulator [Candidatus Omnitrophota bacterium]
MKTEKLNIYKIAQKVGVSIATISRAINPETRKRVASGTLKKIDKLIHKYGYTPNLAAKNLTLASTKTIGLVFPYLPGIFYSNYYNHILAGVSNCLYETGYQFKMLLLKEEKGKWDNYDFKAGERVDGLLITHWFKYFNDKSIIGKMNVPCVIINDIDKTIKAQFVGVDHYLGGQIAANHLYSSGHRRIAVLSGPDWSIDNKYRINGFRAFLKKKGIVIKSDLIVKADYLEHVAYGEIEKILKVDPKITAIFACNDQMAFGAIRRLKEIGISCPDDISVIGFDDEIEAAKFDPPLTTIRVPIYDLATEGTKLLVNYLQNNTSKKPFRGILTLPVQLVDRKSAINITA